MKSMGRLCKYRKNKGVHFNCRGRGVSKAPPKTSARSKNLSNAPKSKDLNEAEAEAEESPKGFEDVIEDK